MEDNKFKFRQRILLFFCIIFSLQAFSWMLIRSFDPFGFYDNQLAIWLFGTERLTEAARKTLAFVLILFGATIAAFFALIFLTVKNAFPARERWAYRAVVVTFPVWFVFDTLVCLFGGAYF